MGIERVKGPHLARLLQQRFSIRARRGTDPDDIADEHEDLGIDAAVVEAARVRAREHVGLPQQARRARGQGRGQGGGRP